MATKFLNRVRMSVAGTPGTGTVTLNAPAVGFQAFDTAGMVDGDQTPYMLEDGSPVGSQWEMGLGTWHANQTFSRDTVTVSSNGGTSKIAATSTAIISGVFRAQDLTGLDLLSQLNDTSIVSPTNGQLLVYNSANGKWENVSGGIGATTPTVVQYAAVQSNSTGDVTVTLGAAPTVGNLLVLLGNGGGGTVSTVYVPGFVPTNFDKTGTFPLLNRYECNYAIRAVRSGDSAGPYTVGHVNSGGPTFSGILAELSGVDITRCSELQMNTGRLDGTSGLSALETVASAGALCLMFAAGDPTTVTVSSPGTVQVNNTANGSTLVFVHDVSTGAFNGLAASSSGLLGALVMSLPGV